MHEVDTITAIATATGEAALAIVRLSGRNAIALADSVFRGRAPLADAAGFTVHYGHLVNRSGEPLDEVLATVFRAPHSYTGEDLVEFSCHGGGVVTASALEALLVAGARAAEPGEFTRRAFLNGRIDLSQAEAVADLIAARSNKAHRASLAQLSGRLGARVGALRTEILDLCALLEIDLDFAEEGLEVIPPADVQDRLRLAAEHVRRLVSTYEEGRFYRDGVTAVFAGRPNAGKSSLFNALLREERAIVTPTPGTTRDFIEESVALDGITFRLIDTAGIRLSTDSVEQAGILRAHNAVRSADIVIVVVDASESGPISAALSEVDSRTEGQKTLVALNKCDLVKKETVASSSGSDIATKGRTQLDGTSRPPSALADNSSSGQEAPVVRVSALTGEGLTELHKALVTLASSEAARDEHDVIITNKRHKEALRRAANSLDTAGTSLSQGVSNEFIALDLREAASALAEITGEVTTEEILNNIFSRFCIGK